ncbi:hypothetical protein A3A67_04900 [Candidatus Peribacteria bacterium RIFCSPLOWO2_01_FULL_51_18]|nr:MAG: hypothetical protein A3C52_01750 [Candidatus Peribacteria bacterium RIFCSPHIGHO2_02_FULL_51_15]OGJ65508.1 MAG: hypothetical protein A3A67_04900 [Candidatus Peribacteria bacterium RIFCSPLOWO2_01_FULL_51_18]OGJ67878.1 MAG: hypothetical protein A3J34_03150 [Candidatus Peribacteria bacterium RIFCSPLOWO2_02_FULL_51_10]
MEGIFTQTFKFKVINGTPLGRACIATKEIIKSEIICKFAGPKISLREFFDKYDINDGNPLQITDDNYIDLIVPYVCFNHSCEPNAGIRNNGILFALRNIPAGEEITYDYSTTIDDVTWQMECMCKKKGCRKVIGDFQSVPHEVKEYYRKNGALTTHIIQTYY